MGITKRKNRMKDRDRKRQQRMQIQVAFVFDPPDAVWRNNKITQLALPLPPISTAPSTHGNGVLPLTMPTTFRRIVPDGNCYFRCISLAISGSEQYYSNIRQSVCQYILDNPDYIRMYLPDDALGSVQLYLQKSRMEMNATWATEVEIFATAFLFQTNIYVYSKHGVHWTWVRHAAAGNQSTKGIYIVHRNQNHFDIVLAVQNSTEIACTDSDQVYRISQPKDLTATQRKDSKRISDKTKYQADANRREKKCKASKLRYWQNKQHRLKKKIAAMHRYTSNNILRAEIKSLAKIRYQNDQNFKRNILHKSKDQYWKDKDHREKKLNESKDRYWNDKSHRQKKLNESIDKYKRNTKFKQKVKNYSKKKYATNEAFRRRVRNYSITKYSRFQSFRQRVKLSSVKKYARNPLFRHMLKKSLKDTYHRDKAIKEIKKDRVFRARRLIENSIRTFHKKINDAPCCVCTVCIRLLYKNQVKKCNRNKYTKGKGANIAEQCLTRKYVEEYAPDEEDIRTVRQTEWICFNCDRYLSKGEMPPQALANNLMLSEIPDVLGKLNVMERQLIAMRIPFMKLLSLPRGGQKGVKGPVVNVPTDLSTVTTSLPRNIQDAQLIKVKLKRKLSYKGHYNYQWINPTNVLDALKYLKENNKWYENIEIDNDWIHEIQNSELVQQPKDSDDDSRYDMETDIEEKTEHSENPYDMETDIEEDKHLDEDSNPMVIEQDDMEETHEGDHWGAVDADEDNINEILLDMDMNESITHQSKDSHSHAINSPDARDNEEDDQETIPVDTCFQPVDIGQDYLDTNRTLCLAPGENQSPQDIFKETGADAMAFPTLLVDGQFGLSHERRVKLSPAKYFNARLFSADTRFSTNKEFIYFAQYVTELNYIRSHISLALRKGQAVTEDGRKLTAGMLLQSDNLSNILKSDIGYRFLQPVRGTPPYWQRTLKDLYAMIRQLGIPTWFVTFSAAEMRWKEVLRTLLDITKVNKSVDELEWADKSSLVMDNPVMCARMFDHRVKALFTDLILSQSAPVGKVVDFFYRTEFQQRGSPHIHSLLWVQDAPKLNEDPDEEVIRFVDKYVSCIMPDEDEDPELFQIISAVQVHNKNHGKSCTKYSTACRFGFPRPPVNKTFITRTDEEDESEHQQTDEELDLEKFNELTKKAERDPKKILRQIWELVSSADESSLSFPEILDIAGVTYQEYTQFLSQVATRTTIHMKRGLTDVWVNNYNADLSRAWNANLDIQFVTDCYACVAYILSYISKAETEMGDLLKNAKKEAEEGNKDAVTAMRQIGNVYLQNREVSSQEAVYRVCSLHLKECSRDVVFAPAGKNITKMSLPINVIQSRSQGQEDENIWMTSIHEKYYARPDLQDFENICLAEFCSKFRILTVSQKPKSNRKTLPVFELKNGLGFIKQCKPGKEAVVRYPRFNSTKNPEDFYLSMIQLFTPHRTPVTLPEGIASFEEYVRTGLLHDRPIIHIIDEKRHYFEIEAESLEKAWEELQEGNINEGAWGYIAAEAEAERIAVQMEKNPTQDGDEEIEEIPELRVSSHPKAGAYSLEFRTPQISKEKLREYLRSMNDAQSKVFYKIRNWCQQKFWKNEPSPFHLFLTGGAGTGKSHLIRCIYHMATAILKCVDSPNSPSVILTAPTGTAAFNIDGATIHSTFNINRHIKLPYQPLTEDSLNSLRNKLDGLQLLIIDEISMVDHKMLTYIHGRLCQLKHNKRTFGGVSILAVGDFFQLPPVKALPLYTKKESNVFDLWKENFEIATLDEVMRQKEDGEFAAMLNRLRTHPEGEDLIESDKQMLLSACYDETPDSAIDALHIFAYNRDVNNHNNKMIPLKCNPVITSMARDFVHDRVTGHSYERKQPYAECANEDLPTSIKLGVGARVMLTRNIDTDDGLVNGAFGTVTAVECKEPNKVNAVFIKFDNEKVGKMSMQKKSTIDPTKKGSVKIETVDDSLKDKIGVTRKQLPLKLGYAATIHKVQGMTSNKIVVSMKNISRAGMAYVALSRATTLQGLHILNFDPDAIFSDKDILEYLQQMPSFIPDEPEDPTVILTILHHNTEGLLPHLPDIQKLNPADIMCFTETWFENGMTIPASLLPDYSPEMLSREDAFKENEALLRRLTHRGGVGIFTKISVTGTHEKHEFQSKGIEAVGVIIQQPFEFILTTVYRSQNYPVQQFLHTFQDILHEIQALGIPSVIVGDFNDNALQPDNCKIIPEVCAFGYSQLVNQPTTDSGSCLDLVFVKGLNTEKIKVTLQQTYYSVHDGIRVSFTS